MITQDKSSLYDVIFVLKRQCDKDPTDEEFQLSDNLL